MIFTFYSYKGGVGRSMALAAIANIFAKRGLRVLVVDFDLEAPGLERYFFDNEGSRLQRAQPGLIDLIHAYRRALVSEEEFAKGEFKRWQGYKFTAIYTASSLGGSVDLMTAGAREPEQKLRDYALAVRTFDWQDFFYNWKGGEFFDWLRRQWIDPSSGYDVVLVDSRTGVTEMGGVCAYQLADVAVLLSAPNYQNLDGTRAVVNDFRSNAVTGLRYGRELQILVVPARIETDHPQKNEFFTALEREIPLSEGLPKAIADAGLDYRSLAIPYTPEFAVGDRLVGGDTVPALSDTKLTAAFERLADALTLLAEPESVLGRQQSEALARLGGVQIKKAVELVADTTRSSAGYDVFLDYSMVDKKEANRLRIALEEAGQRVFIDQTELLAGENWHEGINMALEYSECLYYCIGKEVPQEGREQLLTTARGRGRMRIVPVLFDGADPESLRSLLLDKHAALDLRDWPNPDRLRELIRQRPAAVQNVSRIQAEESTLRPYPGAAPYSEDDSRFFVGREEEVQRLMDALLADEIVFLKGPAKIGKTSLVQAGLLARFRGDVDIKDGIRGNGLVLLQADQPHGLQLDSNTAQLFDKQIGTQHTDYPNFLLIDGIDSFPDDASPAACKARIDAILGLLHYAGPSCHILLIWRDTLPIQERTRLIGAVSVYQHSHVQLNPLSLDALRRAIEEPAKRAGHLLEPGLTERLIESAGRARSAIYQIQLALAALWPERRRGWLTNKSLDALGHLGSVFIRHLETNLALLNEADRDAATILFKTLSRLNPNLKLTPEPQSWDAVATIPTLISVGSVRMRDWLVEHGLLDLWQEDSAKLTSGDQDTLRVALVRPNPMHYLGDGESIPDAAFFMWRGQFATYVLRWNSVARSDDALLIGNALVEAEGWLSSRVEELTEPERSLIDASLAARERSLREQEVRAATEREQERQALLSAEQLV